MYEIKYKRTPFKVKENVGVRFYAPCDGKWMKRSLKIVEQLELVCQNWSA